MELYNVSPFSGNKTYIFYAQSMNKHSKHQKDIRIHQNSDFTTLKYGLNPAFD